MSWLAWFGRTHAGVVMTEERAGLGVIAGRIDQQHSRLRRTTSFAIHATFFSSPEERSFLIPVASIVLGAFAPVLLIACAIGVRPV